MTDRERMMKVMETENLSAKQFALEVGIQPGTISNIAGGRNNPSLDVMQKIYKRFPQYSAAWLFSDKGPMYYHDADEPNLFTVINTPAESREVVSKENTDVAHAITIEPIQKEQTPVKEPVRSNAVSSIEQPVTCTGRRIQRIMVFYTDGTYEER